MTPVGTTAYGTPRTFSATVVNLGTGSKAFGGSISFVDTNGDKLCTTTVQPNTALVGTNVYGCMPLSPHPHPILQAKLLPDFWVQQSWSNVSLQWV